jgi:hypothetical protein
VSKIRIVRPPRGQIDGVLFDLFHVGLTYELSPSLATLLVCEGYAEPVLDFLDTYREQTSLPAYDRAADGRQRPS